MKNLSQQIRYDSAVAGLGTIMSFYSVNERNAAESVHAIVPHSISNSGKGTVVSDAFFYPAQVKFGLV